MGVAVGGLGMPPYDYSDWHLERLKVWARNGILITRPGGTLIDIETARAPSGVLADYYTWLEAV